MTWTGRDPEPDVIRAAFGDDSSGQQSLGNLRLLAQELRRLREHLEGLAASDPEAAGAAETR